jgi:hypothetical protein
VTRHEFGVTRHNHAAGHAKSFLGIAGRVGVIGLDRISLVVVSLFSGDVEAAVQPVDLEHLVPGKHPLMVPTV